MKITNSMIKRFESQNDLSTSHFIIMVIYFLYILVTGPSSTIDTACSSGTYALNQALRSIREGVCDAAIVGGTNICLRPEVTNQFLRLGMLSPDGMCKSFDKDGESVNLTGTLLSYRLC